MTTIPNQKLESMEDEYDERIGNLAYQEYLEDLKNGEKAITLEEMAKELRIELEI